MSVISYRDVFDLVSDEIGEPEIRAGDEVRSGANLQPHFVVVAVDGDKAWVRNVQTGLDAFMLLRSCRKVTA